ncbi:MAG: type VI secretion system protein ImpC [Planctomycetota bacterium]|jgi:type VI secretion system protein ImpC
MSSGSKTAQVIALIEDEIVRQLQRILDAPELQALEGAWRGLHYLVHNCETNADLQIKVLDVSKRELRRDLERAVSYDASELHKKVYHNEQHVWLGEPYSVLLADYEFSRLPADVRLLQGLGAIGDHAHVPIVASAQPALLDLESWDDVSDQPDLAKRMQAGQYMQWRSLRESEDAKMLFLCVPTVVAKALDLPALDGIGKSLFGKPAPDALDPLLSCKPVRMNASFAAGTIAARCFHDSGWFHEMRRVDTLGVVRNLPAHRSNAQWDGVQDASGLKCSSADAIALYRLGFMPLCRIDEARSVFFGYQSVRVVGDFEDTEEEGSRRLASSLPFALMAGRILHQLSMQQSKGKERDSVGKHRGRLHDWVQRYVTNTGAAGFNCTRPLLSAHVELTQREQDNDIRVGLLFIQLRISPGSLPSRGRFRFCVKVV